MRLKTIKGMVYDHAFIRTSTRMYHVWSTECLEPAKWYYIQLIKRGPLYDIHRFVSC